MAFIEARPPQRIPFIWTSELRLFRAAKNLGVHGDIGGVNVLREAAHTSIGSVNQVVLEQTLNSNRANQTTGSGYLTTVPMAINPSSIKWDRGKRKNKLYRQGGVTFQHATDLNGSSNDILELTMMGNTGRIVIRPDMDEDTRNGCLQRQLLWHNLRDLSYEPEYPDELGGLFNTMYLEYTSPLFPCTIQFGGLFDMGISLEERAEKSGSREWSLKFLVQSSFPSIDAQINSSGQLMPTYTKELFTPAS